MIRFSQLPSICEGVTVSYSTDAELSTLATDSRKAVGGPGVIFFAIKGSNHDGHRFLSALYQQGIRNFVVEASVNAAELPNANIFQVSSSVAALQKIAAQHRSTFQLPIIGITGSNGKTIIKEWLFQLLSPDYNIVKNPGSYNSQIGVPLSAWQISAQHQLGIFEAGISRVGEMYKLEEILRPEIGIFTNIGPAHDEGFRNRKEKISEKLKLFYRCKTLVFCEDHLDIRDALNETSIPRFSWGSSPNASLKVSKELNHYRVTHNGQDHALRLPFVDPASVENCFHCIAVMVHLGISFATIQQRILGLRSIPMRLELKEAINHCQIIDDTYNNDLGGLQISLQFLSHQNQKPKKRLILSDLLETGLTAGELSRQINALLRANKINAFVGIGENLSSAKNEFADISAVFFASTEDFLERFDLSSLQNEVILVKGARNFRFERIVKALQKKLHGTVMEIDLNAVVHNLNFFRSILNPATKIMVMVKAFAYGSGSAEIANLLQYHKVDYLGVAYADEGVELRNNNIRLPVMVMNPSEETFDSILQHDLEPEIYSFRILNAWLDFIGNKPAKIHLKVDTGMHRLGFQEDEIPALIEILKSNSHVKVASIFSHLAGADESIHDEFSNQQGELFSELSERIIAALGYRPLLHLLNSPGILRLKHLQFDMVRLGIGLYGVNPTEEKQNNLRPVATLKTVISQIRHVPVGQSIGYGRRGKVENPDTLVGTIAIGYADGYSRAFSRGVGEVFVNGHRAKVIGNVCMDMTMIDLTGIPAREGDEVVVFGKELPITEVAARINTIPYEILTNTSERVKRVFVAESI